MRVFCASKFEQGKGEGRLLPPRCCNHRPLFDFIKRTEEKSTAEKQFYKRRDNATGDGMVTKFLLAGKYHCHQSFGGTFLYSAVEMPSSAPNSVHTAMTVLLTSSA